MKMELPTEKPFLVTVKFEKYGTYTINARSKEHAIQLYENGDWDFDDYQEEWGEYNEVIDEVEEQDVFDEMQLSLEGVLAWLTIQNIIMQFKHSLRMINFIKYGILSKSLWTEKVMT